MFDRMVEGFLREHPTGTVVELGCGLNSRFERVDKGAARWFEIDLPDVTTLRPNFFEENDRRTMLEGSVLEDGWLELVRSSSGPWMVVSEAVLIYLDEADVRRTLERIVDSLPGAWLALDTTDRALVDGQAGHDAMRHLSKKSSFRWPCDEPVEIESWVPGLWLPP